jgi:ribosomal protein L11 methyltransferase
MDFIEVTVKTTPEFAEMLVAELGEVGYDTFQETEEGFCAYITEDQYSEQDLQGILARYAEMVPVAHQTQKIERRNWNEEWEKNFEPLLIGEVCSVRASFHPRPDGVTHDIIINPKMSFGTGHHETTSLMIENQLAVAHQEKRVLDMGCGTGILAILASKMGASPVLAVDVEDWTVENAQENAELNGCGDIEVRHGDVSVLAGEAPFHLILANINRNVLLEDIPAYSELLLPEGILILSGFYTEDLDQIRAKTAQNGLSFASVRTKNNWVSAVFNKG